MHKRATGEPGTGLESLLNHMEQVYYQQLEQRCSSAEHHIAALHNGDVHQTASLYTSLGKKLIEQIAQYVRLRRFTLAPYLSELVSKEDDGHDCRNCSASCTIRHTAQVDGIRETQALLKDTLYRLQSVAVAIPAGTDQEVPYRGLRTEMEQLDTMLSELFALEDGSLIPKVLDAQNAIHARS